MTTTRRSLTRRLALALPLALAATPHPACGAGEEAPLAPATAGGGEGVYSVQLHVHGSFSEGVGSIDSHTFEAADLDLDVIWWSDHDVRIASYRHVTRFGFEDWKEPFDEGEAWSAWTRRERQHRKYLREEAHEGLQHESARFVAGTAAEGERSLRLSATSYDRDFRSRSFRFEAARGRHKRPLASKVTLHIAIRPERTDADARPFLRVGLSEHPPREGLGFEPYALRYQLDNETPEPVRDGATFRIPLRYREGEWNRYALPLTRDAIRGFPFVHGEDNSLHTLSLGVEARGGATATAHFDALRIEQELAGEAAYARQRELLSVFRRERPGLHQLQGVEISYTFPHLNEFSVGTRLLDYDRLIGASGLLRGDPPTVGMRELSFHLVERAVEIAHARGGLVSYNHMLGAAQPGMRNRSWQPREEIYELLRANRVFGADLLEVGYRERGGHDLQDHLWVWDRLALAGLFPVGVGVSDSHGGPKQRWRSAPNNFVSWIYAASAEAADLIEGLRAGRVFFGDLVHFDGELDLTTAGGARMGQVVVTDRSDEEVAVRISSLAPGDRVRLIRSGEPTAEWVAESPAFERRRRIELAPAAPTPVRVEVYGADGVAKVFGNPIVFVREVPEEGVAAERITRVPWGRSRRAPAPRPR